MRPTTTLYQIEDGYALAIKVKKLGDRFFAERKFKEATILYGASKLVLDSWKLDDATLA